VGGTKVGNMAIKIDGNLGFVFPDGTLQKTAVSGVGLGTAQNWTTPSPARTVGQWYYNNSVKPIMVTISRYGGDGSWNILYVQNPLGVTNPAARTSIGNYGGEHSNLNCIVPPYHYYKLDGTNYNWWRELS
jgi:hypothetical protein